MIHQPEEGGQRVIGVLLIDGLVLLRESLAAVLGQEPDITVVAQADSFAEADRWIGTAAVTVVGLDVRDGHYVDFIRHACALNPFGAVLVLAPDSDLLREAFAVEAGASGVVPVTTHIRGLIDAVRRVHAGEKLLPLEKVVQLLRIAGYERERVRAAQTTFDRLTRREREVLQILADGLDDFESARQLNVSPETIKTHVSNIMRKLGVSSRLQALMFAARYSLVQFNRRPS
jgi:two-component system response regulator DevR